MAVWILAPIGGICCGCKPNVCDACGCPSPTLVCDSISASLTKCGFAEYGTPSSPPKIYLTETAGSYGFETSSTLLNVYSGDNTYDRLTCVLTENQLLSKFDNSGPLGTQAGGPYSYDSTCLLYYGNELFPPPGIGICNSPGASSTIASTTNRYWNWVAVGGTWSGAPQTTLSSEYTTAQLITDTVAALPSYPGTFAGTCSSYRNLSADELTYTIRRFKYKFLLPTLSGCAAYAISWMEGSTPKSYTWNGTDTETPVYGPVSEPGSNGTVDINSIVVTCTC